MIKQLKNLIKKNQTLFEIYKKLAFIKDIPLRDYLDFKKLILFKKVYPYTMVSSKALSNVYKLAKIIEKNKTKGAFIECGTWKGGCAAVMAFVADKAKSERKVWLFDSFEGLPEPTDEDGFSAKEFVGKCLACLEDVNTPHGVYKVYFMFDFLIVGTGIFGSSFARIATDSGKSCLLTAFVIG